MELRDAHANGVSRNLGIVPSNREKDWSRSQRAEIVGGVRVLPNVIPADDGIPAERLLQASMELIAIAGVFNGVAPLKQACGRQLGHAMTALRILAGQRPDSH